jgi:uncharacterized protein
METVIVDAGPLVAYLKRDDQDHDWAVEAFQRFTNPLRTCDAALSEAFFLLRQTHGGAIELLRLLERGLVVPDFNLLAELPAVGQLLRRYESVPMSLADACLVRMAELNRGAAVFTLDSDFQIYRRHRRQVIALISPG